MIEFDIQLFFQINRIWTNDFFDLVLPFLRNKVFWAPLYLFLASFFLINYKRKGLWVIICWLATVGATDFVSSKIMKPTFQRERPCNDANLNHAVRNLVRCGPGKSFTSSHATNHFGMAIFLSLLLGRKRKWLWALAIFWAASISYAQVYVGVHFPLDILGGAILGSLIGAFMAKLCRRFIELPY